MNRIGFYCWAGPALIRMTKLKFFNPTIDVESFMQSYDYNYLSKVKEIFGITDCFVMYSFGFSEEIEKEDYEFFYSKLDNFKKLDLKVHAYIQGPNVVYEDFRNKNWYARDEKDRFITYYRGRKVVCINNPEFIDYKLRQIQKLNDNRIDGVFVDNIQMGQLGIPFYTYNDPVVFAGCHCEICNKKFKDNYGENIPTNLEEDSNLTKNYMNFRVLSTNDFLKTISFEVKKNGYKFGTNSFDPKFDTKLVYGTDLTETQKFQDYLLFENHSLPSNPEKKNNYYLKNIIKGSAKPTFVVSYKNGIGYDTSYTQQDFENIYSEANMLSYQPCIKGSEYFTNGIWHNLNVQQYKPIKIHRNFQIQELVVERNKIIKNITKNKLITILIKKYYNQAFTVFMEKRLIRRYFGFLYKYIV